MRLPSLIACAVTAIALVAVLPVAVPAAPRLVLFEEATNWD